MIDTIERITLADLPTPIQDAPRLAQALGLSRLLIKRDDLTGLAMGGNKARKLEYDFAEILKKRCDVVLTIGGSQSNHARMTAAAARKTGLDVKIVLGGPEFSQFQGNLLLNVVLGAEIRYLVDNDNDDDLTERMNEWAIELKRDGHNPYVIPIGGSTGRTALGYVRAMRELAGQVGDGPVQILLPVGSCGTLAGVIIGAKMFMPAARVIGVSVSRTSAAIATRTAAIMEESIQILNADISSERLNVESYDQYFDAYGISTPSGTEAIVTCARLEGIFLDPVYTGKAMAGLMDLAGRGILDRAIPTVFIHTGGSPILFAFNQEFQKLAKFTRL